MIHYADNKQFTNIIITYYADNLVNILETIIFFNPLEEWLRFLNSPSSLQILVYRTEVEHIYEKMLDIKANLNTRIRLPTLPERKTTNQKAFLDC